MDTSFFFQQEQVGFLSEANSVSVFGFAMHPTTSHLVAIAVQGGTTMIEKLHGEISSGKYSRVGVNLDGKYNIKYATANGKYRALKSTIDNSTKRNMIILHDSFYYTPDDVRAGRAKDDNYIYLPLFKEDSVLFDSIYEMVLSITKIGIKREWIPLIVSKGSTAPQSYQRFCGYVRTRDNPSDRIWASAGFNYFWMENNEAKWTSAIKKALESQELKIG